jgi:Predicted sugar kinase
VDLEVAVSVDRVGLVVHQGRTAARDVARAVHAWCDARGIRCTEVDVWAKDQQRRGGRAEAEAAGNPDLVVTLGGDGTFLRGARIAVKSGANVLGVDLGKVGFLTEVPAAEVTRALQAVHDGQATVEERMTLTMRASRALEIPGAMEALLHYGRAPPCRRRRSEPRRPRVTAGEWPWTSRP